MLVITCALNKDKSIRVCMEGKAITEEEIRAAYFALSQVVGEDCEYKEEGGDNNGQ